MIVSTRKDWRGSRSGACWFVRWGGREPLDVPVRAGPWKLGEELRRSKVVVPTKVSGKAAVWSLKFVGPVGISAQVRRFVLAKEFLLPRPPVEVKRPASITGVGVKSQSLSRPDQLELVALAVVQRQKLVGKDVTRARREERSIISLPVGKHVSKLHVRARVMDSSLVHCTAMLRSHAMSQRYDKDSSA
jgi:hypothetical protein